MSGFPTVNFSASDEGLFSPQEIFQLMRVEYDRAQRYDYPAALILVAVDRLEYLQDLYGWESKEEILQAVIKVLRSTTRDSDFLGCMQDDRIMAVFPHTSEATIAAISKRLLRICRELDFRTDGRSLRATISIGAATVRRGSSASFEAFVETAEEAVAFAISSGGDRFVRRESAAEVIENLRQDLEAEGRKISDARVEESEVQAALAPVPGTESELATRLRTIFRSRSGDGAAALEAEVIRVAETLVGEAREQAVSDAVRDHAELIDVLERRVEKLKELLDNTEAELNEMAHEKAGETGIASIYRTVQGMRADQKEAGQKNEMLSLIFEANLELQKKKRRS